MEDPSYSSRNHLEGNRTGRGDATLRPLPGEATLIAGVTALAYLVALAFRVGGLVRLHLPLSLATVRLTDAAVAGLVVLVGGFAAFILMDLVESWRKGTLNRIWVGLLGVSLIMLLFLVGLALLTSLLALWAYAGLAWAVAAVCLVLTGAATAFSALKRMLNSIPAPRAKDLALIRALDKHPAFVGSILLAVVLCVSAFSVGVGGLPFGRTPYMRTATTDEVALSLFEDRVILVGIEPTNSDDATLTGSVRVVPLPTTEIVFSPERVRELRAPGDE